MENICKKYFCFQAPGESLGPLDSSFLHAHHEPGAAGPVVEPVQVSDLIKLFWGVIHPFA
jgi:hypothetical protein